MKRESVDENTEHKFKEPLPIYKNSKKVRTVGSDNFGCSRNLTDEEFVEKKDFTNSNFQNLDPIHSKKAKMGRSDDSNFLGNIIAESIIERKNLTDSDFQHLKNVMKNKGFNPNFTYKNGKNFLELADSTLSFETKKVFFDEITEIFSTSKKESENLSFEVLGGNYGFIDFFPFEDNVN